MLCMAKAPGVDMNLMIPKEAWPFAVRLMDQLEITYVKERQIHNETTGDWVVIQRLQGRGDKLIRLILEMDCLEQKMNALGGPNYYISFRPKKGVKRVVRKVGEEAGSRSEGGDPEPGQAD